MVRKERFELSRVTPLAPKASASTSSATFAFYLFHPRRALPGSDGFLKPIYLHYIIPRRLNIVSRLVIGPTGNWTLLEILQFPLTHTAYLRLVNLQDALIFILKILLQNCTKFDRHYYI